ncbi:MAG: cell division protein ZapE [Hyphomicrobium aestuarii]|nr:cell division protein ZapE [Hyphomicrobium aestuarii]
MGGVLAAYEKRVASGALTPDPAQAECAARLDRLAASLVERERRRKSLFGRLNAGGEAPRGLYIHGGVGRGKTMLMDVFYDATPVSRKRRVHFHAFMADIHDRIGEARKSTDGDPIPAVGAKLAQETQVLCFDELFVRDIADAMVLGRLFRVLFEAGTIVVATSNARPDDLYKHGLNRQLFLPFIDEIEDRLDVVELVSVRDFRLAKLSGQQLYFAPAGPTATAALNAHWLRLTGETSSRRATLTVKGRTLSVPQAAMGAARFAFADLCEAALGPLDYLAIAKDFHTVMLDDIPILGPGKRNEARRFITLIDALYDNQVCLIASADAEPGALYTAGDGADHFQRTASRLMEMRSDAFLAGRAKRAA